MKTVWTGFLTAVAAFGGWVGWFMGGWDGFMRVLVMFSVIDYITGVMHGILIKDLSSEIGLRGIFKKVLMFALVGVGYMIDSHIIGDGGVVRTAVLFFFISNEGISLLENASRVGLPIPQKLRDVLAQLHSKNDDKDGDGS